MFPECLCNTVNTINSSSACDRSGQCRCSEGYSGLKCDSCSEGFSTSGTICIEGKLN